MDSPFFLRKRKNRLQNYKIFSYLSLMFIQPKKLGDRAFHIKQNYLILRI
jgi:hypothetical protein